VGYRLTLLRKLSAVALKIDLCPRHIFFTEGLCEFKESELLYALSPPVRET